MYSCQILDFLLRELKEVIILIPMRSLSVDLVSFNHNKAVLYKSFDTYSSVWYHEKLYETENMLEQMDFDVYFIPYYLEPTPDVIEYVFGIQVDEHKSFMRIGILSRKVCTC